MVKCVRKAKYAGSFYPSNKLELSKIISSLLLKSKPKKLGGELKALIVPHAGYVYSGEVAAFAYNSLKIQNPKRVVLLGPSHQDYIDGIYSFSGEWVTPLKITKVFDSGLNVFENDSEHSLEVELPFLQSVLSDFEFIPIIYGVDDYVQLARVCSKFLSDDSVLIASSDLSHYLPYTLANKIDLVTTNAILELDLKGFLDFGDACGKTGIAAILMLALKNKWKPVLLSYKNSGDTAGDKMRVVGYAAIAFIK